MKDTDLVAATHGRSFWILDDLTPLHQMADQLASADAHLFAPRPAVRWRAYRGHGPKPGPGREIAYRLAGSLGYAYRQVTAPTGEKIEAPLDAGENPPNGVIVHYWLKDAPRGDLTLSFLDAGGRELRTFTSRARDGAHDDAADSTPEAASSEEVGVTPAPAEPGGDEEPRPTKDAGANRFVWNLRGPAATKLPDNKGRGGTLDMLTAPRVPPGAYQVRLTVGGRTLTQPFEIVKDPRVQASDADLREQFAWAKKAHDLLTRVHDAVLRLRDVRSQAEGWAAPRSDRRRQGRREGAGPDPHDDRERAHPGPLGRPTNVPRQAQLPHRHDRRPPRLRRRPTPSALRDLYDNLALRADMELAKLDRYLTDDVPPSIRSAAIAASPPSSRNPRPVADADCLVVFRSSSRDA